MTSLRLTEVDHPVNTMAMTVSDLSGSITLSQNGVPRNTLQKSAGSLKSMSNGFSVT